MADLFRVRHHGIVVDAPIVDMINFYGRLGFSDIRAEELPDAQYISCLSGREWTQVEIVKVANLHGDVIEFIRPAQRDPIPQTAHEKNWSHLAVTVPDCEAMVLQLRNNGATLVGGPVINPDAPFKVAYVRDPSGNLIELVEPITRN